MFKNKKTKLIAILTTNVVALSVALVVSTISWYSTSLNVRPEYDVPSSIRSSYFDINDPEVTANYGKEENPYVITKPVHYYNLVRLQEIGSYGFDSSTYFQFGKIFNGETEYKFYNFNNDGTIGSGYSTTLNMTYYSGENSLLPIGSVTHPFVSHIIGNDLTISNLHIKSQGKTDIGVFGYVASGATVANLYFDNVTYTLDGMTASELNEHTSHSTYGTFGFIAGHVSAMNQFSNVYVNHTKVHNEVNGLSAKLRNDYAYFGYCDTASSIPNIGEEAYRHTYRPDDVYNFMDANYSTISSNSFKARNTEYKDNQNLGHFGDNISHTDGASDYYTFKNVDGRNYSLATAGYQDDDETYIAQYKTGNSYFSMTGATTTETSPSSQDVEGQYVYWDSANNKWIYYTAVASGGQGTATFKVFSISYQGVNGNGDFSGSTYYLRYNNGSLDFTTTAPTSVQSTPDYYFAFLTTPSAKGASDIGDGTSSTFYIYSPNNQKYLYVPDGLTMSRKAVDLQGSYPNSLQFTDRNGLDNLSGYAVAQFTLSGSSGTSISFNYNGVKCYIVHAQSGSNATTLNAPHAATRAGDKPFMFFTLHGSSGDAVNETKNHFVNITSASEIEEGKIITFAWYSSSQDLYHGISGQNETGNRAATVVPVSQENGVYSFVPGDDVARFVVGENANGFTLRDQNYASDFGYLYYVNSHTNPDTGSNHSNNRIWTKTETDHSDITDNNSTWTLNNLVLYNYEQSSRYFAYNAQNRIWACYTSAQQKGYKIFKLINEAIDVHYEHSYNMTAPSNSSDDLSITSYDIYYYDEALGPGSRQQLTSTYVSGWSLSEQTTYVTIAPEIVNGWNLITNDVQLKVGEKYAIAHYDSGTSGQVAGTYNTSNRYLTGVNSTFASDGNSITTVGEGVSIFTLGGNYANGYTLSNDDGQLYGASNGLNYTGNSGVGRWDISISSNGTATIKTHTGTAYYIRYNASGYFSTYNTTLSVRLYRYDSNEPQYVGDKLGNGYSPDYIDAVGKIDFYSSYSRMTNSDVTNLSEGTHALTTWYNTKFVDNALVIRIPNRGSLDYGTLTINCKSTTPIFVKTGGTVSLNSVYCENTGTSSDQVYTLYLNKYNIYKLSYCTLNSSGQINGWYNTSGQSVYSSESIDEFILVLGAATDETVDITYMDIAFSTLVGNVGDFGQVGFRSAPGTVEGEIIGFTYEFASVIGYVENDVTYDSATDTYTITLYTTSDVTIYIYNYDANKAKVKLKTANGTSSGLLTNVVGPYNEITVAGYAKGSWPTS